MDVSRGSAKGSTSRQTLLIGVALAAFLIYVADMIREGGAGFSLLPRGPLVGAPFALMDAKGAIVRDSDFAGRFRLITFGAKRCAAVCAADVAAMLAAQTAAAAAGGDLVAVFVALDGEPSSSAGLAALAQRFPSELWVLGGPAAEVRAVAAAFSVVPAALTADEAAGFVFLMGPEGDYVAHFPAGTAAEELVRSVLGYLELS